MTPQEAAALLYVAARIDYRKPNAETAEEWAGLLNGLSPYDCVAAIRRHYSTTSDWIMPSHIIAGVKRAAAERRRHSVVDPPNVDPDDVHAYLDGVRQQRAEVDRAERSGIPQMPAGPRRNTLPDAQRASYADQIRAELRAVKIEVDAARKPQPEPLLRPEDHSREPEAEAG